MMAQRNTEPDSVEISSDFEPYKVQAESSRKEIADQDDVDGFLTDPVKVKSFLSCEKCKQNFDVDKLRPLLLPCLSAICTRCVQDLWASNNTSFKCSSCHCSHICNENGKILLPYDSIRESVLEIVRLTNRKSNLICEMCRNDQKAINRCLDCSYFICLNCTKLHSSLRPLENHSLTAIENLLAGKMENLSLFSRTTYCPIQGHEKETLKMFCSTESCMKAVCLICAISTHKNHIISDLAKVVYEKRHQIEKAKGSVQLRKKQAHTSLTLLKEMDARNSNESLKVQDEIMACFNEAKKALDQRALELCNAVRAKQSEKETKFDLEKKRLDKFVDSCLQTCHYVNIAPYMTNHQAFLNVSNAIERQLEKLESQAVGKQLSFSTDTLKFISGELDLPFKKTANGLGKLVVTKVCSFKSKVIVKPAPYDVSQEITFQITLVSLEGSIIDDEDVKVSLKHKGQILTLIQCSFEKSSQTYNGNWISHVPTEISWNVLSNDIELETLKGDLQVKRYSTGNKTDTGKTITSSDLSSQEQKCCTICMDTPSNPERLKKCGHIFCRECIEQCFKYKPSCPSCGQIYGKMKGDQPPGSILMRKGYQRLEGFNDCHSCIVVTYTFDSGSQGSEHPNPGKWYKGISRSGYVPNNEKGRLIAKLLNVAFSRHLVFTIGRSRTTGQDGVITWNDIHHKTRPD